MSDPSQILSDPVKSPSDPSQIPIGSESKFLSDPRQKSIHFLESTWGAWNRCSSTHSEHNPPAHRCRCGGCVGGGPATDGAWAIGNFRKIRAPSAKFPQTAYLLWSVCLVVSMLQGIQPLGCCLGRQFSDFADPILEKKVLREPASNRAKFHQKSNLSETIEIDSGGSEWPFDALVGLFRTFFDGFNQNTPRGTDGKTPL